MFVGTTEAAYLLGISCSRVRQLLQQGRIKESKKVGRVWKIPLFNGMPVVIEGRRGPKGTWKKRQQKATTIIHVNRRVIDSNRDHHQTSPAIIVRQGSRKAKYCHEAEITGPCRLVYRPLHRLNCGAVLWIEVEPAVRVETKLYN
ncbi:MAG: DNA-binding protein [Heteroscytonema crispum UTEX LB 1556]